MQTIITNKLSFLKIYCGVVAVVARDAHNVKVAGSSPAPATKGRTDIFYSKFDGKSETTKTKLTNFF